MFHACFVFNICLFMVDHECSLSVDAVKCTACNIVLSLMTRCLLPGHCGSWWSALTHPAVRVVQRNLPRAGSMELVPIVFGMYIRISKLCTLRSVSIDQELRVLIFKQCHWNAELTQALSTCTFLCIVEIPFGNAALNETHTGLFSVVIYRSNIFGSWELYV